MRLALPEQTKLLVHVGNVKPSVLILDKPNLDHALQKAREAMLPLFVALARAETFERKANEHVAPVFWTIKSHKRMFECVVVARQFGE